MAFVKKTESKVLSLRKALDKLMHRYENTPRQLGEKHKLYRSIILLQEELDKLEINKSEPSTALCSQDF